MIVSGNPPSTRDSGYSRCALLFMITTSASFSIHAATRTWDGDAGNGQWNTATNWSSNTLPGPGDDVVFSGAGPPGTISGGNTVIDRLVVSANGYTFSGNTLVVGTVNISGNTTVTSLSGSWTASTIEVAPNSELRITSGESLGNLSILGTLVVSQTGIVDGTTLTLSGGRIVVDGTNARVNASSISGTGDLIVRNSGVVRCKTNPTTVSVNPLGTFRLRVGEAGAPGRIDCAALTLSGDAPGDAEFLIDHTSAGYLFQRPDGNLIALGGNMRLTVRGGGSTILRGTHTFTGPTTLVGASTILDLDGTLGNTAVTVGSSTALRGRGRINGPVTLQSSGALLPGLAATGGIGTIRVASLDAPAGSEIRFNLATPDVSGGTNDLIEIDTTASIAGNVRILNIGAVGSYPLFSITGSGSMTLPPIASMPNGFVPADWFLRPRTSRIDLAQRGVLSWQPNSLTFVATEGASTTATTTLANAGPGFVDVASIPAPTDPRFTRVGGTCPNGAFTLSASTDCTVQYRFLPNQPGSFAGNVLVSANAKAPLPGLDLSGSASQRLATATPSGVDFGTVVVGSSPPLRVISITNPSAASVTIVGTSVSPQGTFDVASSSCSSTLQSLGTCTVTVRFTPQAVGADAAELAVLTGAGDVLVPMAASAVAAAILSDGFEQ